MSETITTAQVERLREAVASAREPGGCVYVLGGQPCCVIAQLGALEGVTVEELEAWDERLEGSPLTENVFGLLAETPQRPGVDRLANYPTQLLQDLQQCWDDCIGEDEDGARADMLSMVDGWPLETDGRGAQRL